MKGSLHDPCVGQCDVEACKKRCDKKATRDHKKCDKMAPGSPERAKCRQAVEDDCEQKEK